MKPFSAFCAVGAISLLLVFTAEASEKKSRGREASLNRPIPGATHSLSGQSQAVVPIPFFDNFESGAAGWTSDGFFNLIENPQNQRVLSPAISPTLVILPDAGFLPSAYSTTHAWWFGEVATGTFIGSDFSTLIQDALGGGTSVNPQTGSLVSPPLDLTLAARARLSFRTWWEIEGVDVDRFDLMYVEVSVDGGISFLPLGRGVINPLDDPDGEPWKSYSSGGLGLPGVWIGQLFDLTPYVGNILYLRFRFDTIDDLYNGFRGWFIDDVSVTADLLSPPQITSIVPPVSFPGELVSINGQNFVNGAVVTVGGEVASAVISTNLAVVKTPFLSAGQYDVTVT
ncbi:MAG TPA: IPT/TIG domain-containing protein, partial [Bacteroidota bacterium]